MEDTANIHPVLRFHSDAIYREEKNIGAYKKTLELTMLHGNDFLDSVAYWVGIEPRIIKSGSRYVSIVLNRYGYKM